MHWQMLLSLALTSPALHVDRLVHRERKRWCTLQRHCTRLITLVLDPCSNQPTRTLNLHNSFWRDRFDKIVVDGVAAQGYDSMPTHCTVAYNEERMVEIYHTDRHNSPWEDDGFIWSHSMFFE